MSSKLYYIEEMPDIIVRNGEFCYILREPLELEIYKEKTKVEYIPLGIFVQNNKRTIELGGKIFDISFNNEENDSRVLIEYDYYLKIGPNEKKKILRYIIAKFIDKTHLVDDYSKKEYFFDPENNPELTMAEKLKS